MTEHTQGPWQVTRDTGGARNYVVRGSDDWYLAEVSKEANANLMAAAPELLAALVAIRECTFVDPAQSLSTPCKDCMDMVNAAIAKAKGEPCPTE